MATPFFTSEDPDFRMTTVLAAEHDRRIFTTAPMSYPTNYEAQQFKFVHWKGARRLFCRTLKLIFPTEGFWVVMGEFLRPSEEAEAHYVKQLKHMDFPQILPYVNHRASTPLPSSLLE